jgi:hypothetical protein
MMQRLPAGVKVLRIVAVNSLDTYDMRDKGARE